MLTLGQPPRASEFIVSGLRCVSKRRLNLDRFKRSCSRRIWIYHCTFHGFTPAIGVCIISLVVLAIAVYARSSRQLFGAWRWVFVACQAVAFAKAGHRCHGALLQLLRPRRHDLSSGAGLTRARADGVRGAVPANAARRARTLHPLRDHRRQEISPQLDRGYLKLAVSGPHRTSAPSRSRPADQQRFRAD
jgi:hypothetical protein